MRRKTFGVVVMLALALAAPARAQSPEDVAAAREFFLQGAKASREQRWNDAELSFSLSLERKKAAITLYSLGVAQMQAGHIAAALASFRAFLAEPVESATTAYTKPATDAIAELERRVGKVRLQIEPAGLADLVILIDGKPIPTTEHDSLLLVDPGVHEVTARAPNYQDGNVKFSLEEGGSTTANISLQPVPPIVTQPVPPIVTQPVPPIVTQPAPDKTLPTGAFKPLVVSHVPPSRVLPVSLMVGGGVVFVSGMVVGLVGIDAAAQAPTRDGSAANSARAMMLGGDIVAGVGLACASAGLIVFLMQGSRASQKIAVEPWVAPTAAGVRIRF